MSDIKSKAKPLCRWCGRPLRVRTTCAFVVNRPGDFGEDDDIMRHVQGPVADRAAAQRLTNDRVVAVRYRRPDHEGGLSTFTTWDGESYRSVHGLFCKNDCAMAMGRYAVEKCGVRSDRYLEALSMRSARRRS